MKKIYILIISIFFIFSIQNINAKEWIIEDLFNLNYWPMIYDLSLEKLESYNFTDSTLKNIYNKFKTYDNLIRNEIIDKHKIWEFDFYTTNWIIKNYKTYVYYTNEFFYLLSLVEKNPSLKEDVEFQIQFLKTYKNSALYYQKVKNLITNN